jgi:hypothetical protein
MTAAATAQKDIYQQCQQELLRLLALPELSSVSNFGLGLGPNSGDPAGPLGFVATGCLVGLLGFDEPEHEGLCETCVHELLRRELLTLARPVGRGGLLLSLAACCVRPGEEQAVGCAVVLPAPRHVGASDPPDIEQQLFAEARGRYLLCIPAEKQADARLVAREHGVPLWPLGRTGGRELVVRASASDSGFVEVVRLSLRSLREASLKTTPDRAPNP